MKTCVIDASVAAAAFFQEPHAAAAREVLIAGRTLHAPDLIYAEFGNVVWKRHRRGVIDDEEAAELLSDFLRLPLEVAPSSELAATALQLAMRTGRTMYDSLYLALALKRDAPLVTCDKRLVNALADTPLAEQVVAVDHWRSS